MKLSIISPIYKGEKMLEELISRIQKSVSKIQCEYEIILVNDKSPDNSWDIIKKNSEKDNHIKGINLSRNFGQHYAITAGLTHADGEWIIVMDCDLQDRPEEIPNLYNKAIEGYDAVIAQRIDRQDKFLKRMSSIIFYHVFSFLTNTKLDNSISNFGIYNKKIVNAILSMGDSIRFFPIMVQWVGFKKYYLPVQHAERSCGSSGYNLIKLLQLASDNMIGFSDKPLKFMLKTGFYVVIFSLLFALYYILKWSMGSIEVDGFTTLVISIWFAVGFITMMLGITGLYIGKIYDRVKGRPLYIIEETLGID